MATSSSILAWRIPWTKKPDALQSIGSQRVGHDYRSLALIIPTNPLLRTEAFNLIRKKDLEVISLPPNSTMSTVRREGMNGELTETTRPPHGGTRVLMAS